MKSLKKYVYLNALLRTRLSRCLDTREMSALTGAADMSEVASLLRGTDYRELSALIESGAPLKLIEKALLKIEIGRHRSVLGHARGAVANLIFSLMELYDVGKVQGLLRLWREKEWEERDSIIEEKICWDIPADDILKAASIEEIILLLDATPYKKALMAGYARYRHSGQLFPLEVALEADYYQRLWETVEALGNLDSSVAARIMGIEIDVRNIEILLRLKRYSSLPAGDARGVLLPGGLHLSEQILVDAYLSKDARALIAALQTMPLPPLRSMAGARGTVEQLRLIGALLGEILEREARRALGGYPFTIGTVIAYFALVRAEAHAVRRILAGKSLGLPTERILRSVGI